MTGLERLSGESIGVKKVLDKDQLKRLESFLSQSFGLIEQEKKYNFGSKENDYEIME